MKTEFVAAFALTFALTPAALGATPTLQSEEDAVEAAPIAPPKAFALYPGEKVEDVPAAENEKQASDSSDEAADNLDDLDADTLNDLASFAARIEELQNRKVLPDLDGVKETLALNGFKSETKTEDDQTYLEVDFDGVKTILDFLKLDNDVAYGLSFYAGFTGTSASLSDINSWNAEHRFARAHIDDEGDPIVEMEINLDYDGMPEILFEDYLDIWNSLAAQFSNYVAETSAKEKPSVSDS